MKQVVKHRIASTLLVCCLSVNSAAAAQTEPVIQAEAVAILTDSTYDYAGDGAFGFRMDSWEPGKDEFLIDIANKGTRSISYKYITPDGYRWSTGTIQPGQNTTIYLVKSDPVTFLGTHMIRAVTSDGSVGRVTITARTY